MNLLFYKLVSFGVLPRNKLKNSLRSLASLVRQGLVRKVFRRGRVFYELTDKALPLLDSYRLQLLQQARLRSYLYPRRRGFYQALLEDVRFLDTTRKEVQDFLFLGDWQLNRAPVKAQLRLAQLRYYETMGL